MTDELQIFTVRVADEESFSIEGCPMVKLEHYTKSVERNAFLITEIKALNDQTIRDEKKIKSLQYDLNAYKHSWEHVCDVLRQKQKEDDDGTVK